MKRKINIFIILAILWILTIVATVLLSRTVSNCTKGYNYNSETQLCELDYDNPPPTEIVKKNSDGSYDIQNGSYASSYKPNLEDKTSYFRVSIIVTVIPIAALFYVLLGFVIWKGII